jgi:hypothetical protein
LLQADEDIHCLTIELSQTRLNLARLNLARLRGRPELGLGFLIASSSRQIKILC